MLMKRMRMKIQDDNSMPCFLKTASTLFVQIEKRVASANILEMELESSLRKKKREKQKANAQLAKSAGL